MSFYRYQAFLSIIIVAAFGTTPKNIALNRLTGIYCNASNQSFFIYEFLNDSSYQFRTQGHFGNIKIEGAYMSKGDSVMLRSYFKGHEQMDTLLIVNDSSLISTDKMHKYCKIS